MGQQQLLLVILVTIIVGIATVVAINIFGQAAEQANQDAVRQDLLAAATNAQAMWARPVMMGGTGNDFTEERIGAEQFAQRMGIPGIVSGLEVDNENAEYTIVRVDAESVRIDADPKGSPGSWSILVERTTDGEWRTTLTPNVGEPVIMGPS